MPLTYLVVIGCPTKHKMPLPYSPEQLKEFLEQAGFCDVEIHRKKPTYATIIGRRL